MRKKISGIIIITALFGLMVTALIERGSHFWTNTLAPPRVTIETPKTQTPTQASVWEFYGDGAARREYWFKNSTQGRLILYRFDQNVFKARLVHRTPALPVREWLPQDAHDMLVVNGVYFDEADFPVGYTLIDGKRIGKGTLTGKTTTMIGLSPRVRFGVDRASVRDGFQTYPVLIKNSKAAVTTDSKLYARRTIIGVDTAGMVYVGIVPDSTVSLFELARVLEGLDIPWASVANLDGGPSSGLAARFGNGTGRHEETLDSMTLVPNVLVIERQ